MAEIKKTEEEGKVVAKEKASTKKEAPEKKKPPRILTIIGKRKTAVARATVRGGKGIIRINKVPIGQVGPNLARLKLQEPMELAKDAASQVDIDVDVKGGGVMAQAAAARQAIARGLVAFTKSTELRNLFITYDRSLLVNDPRQTEPHKFSRSSKGARRRKQLSRR